MKHCWHKDDVQVTTWTPGEERAYTCCFCGRQIDQKGVATAIPGHGPYVATRYEVSYVLPDDECPSRS